MSRRLEFPGTDFPPVDLPDRASLPQYLTIRNSPVRFSCRNGICGTCLIEAESIGEPALEPPDEAERQILRLHAPGNPRARLACQLTLNASIRIRKL